MIKSKKYLSMFAVVLVLCCIMATTAFAAGTGDVAGAVQSTWGEASGQIKTVVNNVVFPAVDMILAIFFFVKLGMVALLITKRERSPIWCRLSFWRPAS